MSVLFGLMTLLMILKYLDCGKSIYLFLSCGFIFPGLLSKENAIVFIGIVCLLFFLNFKKSKFSRYVIALLILGVASGLYFAIRWKVLGGFSTAPVNELMNNPFLNAQENQKLPTILYTLLLYLKLLVFPHPLTYDYYPYHIQLQSWTNPLVILSLAIYAGLLFVSFYFFKKNKILAFGTAFFLITLLPVSNLLVNIGSFMNERFLFIPSIGFAIAAGYLSYTLLKKIQSKALFEYAFIIIVCLFSVKTIVRNRDWKDNFTLFTHDVKISENSAKGNCTAGGALLEKSLEENDTIKRQEYLARSVKHLNKALEIYPNYVDALLLLGNAIYHNNRNYNRLFKSYEKLFKLAPNYDLAYSNLHTMLVSEKKPEIRKTGYKLILKYKPDDFNANYELGSTYGKMLNKFDSAQIYLSFAVQMRPESKLANRDMGVACALSGDFGKSLPYFEKVLEIDPNDPANYINLGISYQNLGNTQKAEILFHEAERLKNE
jgi:tetratricopeptide (TPR) repeat protein